MKSRAYLVAIALLMMTSCIGTSRQARNRNIISNGNSMSNLRTVSNIADSEQVDTFSTPGKFPFFRKVWEGQDTISIFIDELTLYTPTPSLDSFNIPINSQIDVLVQYEVVFHERNGTQFTFSNYTYSSLILETINTFFNDVGVDEFEKAIFSSLVNHIRSQYQVNITAQTENHQFTLHDTRWDFYPVNKHLLTIQPPDISPEKINSTFNMPDKNTIQADWFFSHKQLLLTLQE